MIDAVAQLGILMLLLLTGMETDLQLVRRVGRPAVTAAAAGVALPFVCGGMGFQIIMQRRNDPLGNSIFRRPRHKMLFRALFVRASVTAESSNK
jgi:Kef-type K+ transport system membrane component KefB